MSRKQATLHGNDNVNSLLWWILRGWRSICSNCLDSTGLWQCRCQSSIECQIIDLDVHAVQRIHCKLSSDVSRLGCFADLLEFFQLTTFSKHRFLPSQAHFNAPKYLKELKNNTMGRFSQVIAWSFGSSVALYSIITAMGFLTFGAASNGLILNNYSTQDTLMSLSRLAVALSVTGSYPLLFDGTRDGLLDLFKVPQEKRTNALFNKITLGVLAVTTAVAAKLTDLGLVASVGGATFGTALVFIYPTIMFIKSQKGKSTKETTFAKIIAALGVVMGAIGTVLALKE